MNTTHALPARNAEIVRRRLAGETPTALAQEFGVSISRISMLVRKAQMNAVPPAKASAKPRMRELPSGRWWCHDDVASHTASTGLEAYQGWLTTAIAALQPVKAEPKAPVVREAEQPYRGEVTVVRGALVASRSLSFAGDKRMVMAMERAGLAQAPIRGMCGPSPSARAE